MQQLIKWLALLSLILTALGVLPNRSAVHSHDDLDLPAKYLPGSDASPTSPCWYDHYDGYDMSSWCNVHYAGHTVNYTYTYTERAVTYTSVYLYDDALTVGDLVNAWGTPTGMRGGGSSMYIFWGNRSAYTFATRGVLAPDSRVYFVSWWSRHELERYGTMKAWKGFISVH